MKTVLFGMLVLFSATVSAASDFCSRTRNDLQLEFWDTKNHLAFNNAGGILGSGVCWWHSRLQRSSLYLATYAPTKAKPSRSEAIQLIRDLTFLRSVVEIPGYSNFLDFSRDYQKEIQHELTRWMMRDSFIQHEWVKGLTNQARLTADEMKQHMDALYQEYLASPAGFWVMAQLKGIDAHSLLIIGMHPIADGYEMISIDSNHATSIRYHTYHQGDVNLVLGGLMKSYRFVPYAGFGEDMDLIDAAIADYCKD